MSAVDRRVTPQRATIVGSVLVTGLAIALLLFSWFVTARFFSGIAFFAVWFPFFGVAWLYWSLPIARWRTWVNSSCSDLVATQQLAVLVGLTWPKGWVFEKTEIPTEDHHIL
jgi:membrane protein YdbS with pleckstrin-like domain